MKAFDYFRAELLRFRPWAIAYFLLHLVVVGFLTRVVDLAQQPLFVYQMFGGVYLVSGLLLGAYQMGNYRRPNAWLNLLHRPVEHRQLALALMGASATLLAIGVLAPILLAAAYQEWATPRVVDLRHVQLAVSALLLALSGYLIGAYALLANRRWAVAGFIFLALFGNAAAVGAGASLLQLLVVAWLAAMVLAAFKPDLAASPRGAFATTVVAGPLQMAMWFALILCAFGFELLWIMQGTHPNNPPVPIPGSAKEADNATGRELMVLGLASSRDAQAGLWREQAAISEVYTMGPGLTELPQRNEMTNSAPMEFDDGTRRQRWVFSHDDMRFHGYSLAEQKATGTLGIDGGKAFAEPPLPAGNGFLVTRHAVYQYDEEAQRILPRAALPAAEEIVGLDDAGERIGVLSQQALYLYDKRDLDTGDGLLQPRLRVPMPARVGRLARIDTMELLDGVLVSFTYTREVFRGGGTPFQSLVRTGEDGASREVAHRVLSSGYGPVYMYSSWWFSPALFEVQRALTHAFSGYHANFDVAPPPRPRIAYLVAGVAMLASLLLAAWRSRRVELSPAARALWIALCGLVGMPALMAFWLLYPPRERLDDSPSLATATP